MIAAAVEDVATHMEAVMTEPLDLDAIEARWAAFVKDGPEDQIRAAMVFVEPLIAEVKRLRAENARLQATDAFFDAGAEWFNKRYPTAAPE